MKSSAISTTTIPAICLASVLFLTGCKTVSPPEPPPDTDHKTIRPLKRKKGGFLYDRANTAAQRANAAGERAGDTLKKSEGVLQQNLPEDKQREQLREMMRDLSYLHSAIASLERFKNTAAWSQDKEQMLIWLRSLEEKLLNLVALYKVKLGQIQGT